MLSVIALGLIGVAQAQSEGPAVSLDLSACPRPEPSEVRRLLALELRGRLLDEAAPGALAMRVRCSKVQAAIERAGEPTRELDLTSVPDTLRARLLALALAELAVASTPPTPRAEPAPPPPPAPLPSPRRVEAQRHRLSLGALLQVGTLSTAGASMTFTQRLGPWGAWTHVASFSQGETALDGGRLRVRQAALRSGPALLRERGPLTLALGVAVRAGVFALRGLPADGTEARGQTFSTWVVGPSAFSSLALRVARHLFVALELELQHTVRTLRAEVRGGSSRTLSAWWGNAGLAVGASW